MLPSIQKTRHAQSRNQTHEACLSEEISWYILPAVRCPIWYGFVPETPEHSRSDVRLLRCFHSPKKKAPLIQQSLFLGLGQALEPLY